MEVSEPSGAAGEGVYKRLPGGPGLDAKEVSEHQRWRLERAMVEACAASGYARLKVSEVVAVAGVSKSAFYSQFSDKEECFLVAYDSLVKRAVEEVARAAGAEQDWEAAMRAGFERLIELVIADPPGARLVVVESLALGGPGLRSRARASNAFEALLTETLGHSGHPVLETTTIRSIVQGVKQVIYRALRSGEIVGLRQQGPELAEWAIGYTGMKSPDVCESEAPRAGKLLWEFEPNSSEARIRYGQRERITQAVVRLASETERQPSIPEISARAGISNAAFYKHFADKQEALLTPFDAFIRGAVEAAVPVVAAAGTWEERVRAGIRASIEFIASEPEFAWVAYVEVSVAGEAAIEHGDAGMALYEAPLRAENGAPRELGEAVIGAIVGGVFGSIQLAIGEGNLAKLRDHIPELLNFALAPFGLEER